MGNKSTRAQMCQLAHFAIGRKTLSGKDAPIGAS